MDIPGSSLAPTFDQVPVFLCAKKSSGGVVFHGGMWSGLF